MNWRLWGPLIFAGLLFVVTSAIRIVSFAKFTFYIDLAPELALWATGVLFSFSVSEQALFGGRTEYDVRKTKSGTGVEMNFRVALPDNVEFSPRMVYLFVVCMAIWILDVLFAGKAERLIEEAKYVTVEAGSFVLASLAIAGIAVGIALRALREVG